MGKGRDVPAAQEKLKISLPLGEGGPRRLRRSEIRLRRVKLLRSEICPADK